MNNQAYDKKNSEDYKANTLILNKALQEIECNRKLQATVAQLSKMTRIHRNTITNRVWPIQKLKQIKEARKIEDKSNEKQVLLNKESMEEKLIQAQNEVIYWFNMYQDIKRFYDHSNKQLKDIKVSRDYYIELYKTEHRSLLAAEREIDRLIEFIELKGISSEQLRH
jgi:hypothetical protein